MAKTPEITYRDVKSSNVSRIGYDEDTETLGVVFQNGGTYHYAKVPKSVYDALAAADSAGAFIAAHVKGRYQFTKV